MKVDAESASQQRWSELQDQLGADGPIALGLLREALDLPVVCHFTVEGDPVSKSRARYNASRGGAYTPRRTKEAEEAVAWRFRMARRGWPVDATSGFGVFAVFHCATRQRRDVDNLLKLVMDALTGVVWRDDAQVSEISARIHRASDDARSELVIYRTGPADGPPTRACERCGTDFQVFPSTQDRRFCSAACASASRRTRPEVRCLACDRSFFSKVGEVHCSAACRRASAHRRAYRTCAQCLRPFTRAQSVAARSSDLCSAGCREAWARAHPTTARGGGTCHGCGARTSRKAYTRCQACKAAGVTPKT